MPYLSIKDARIYYQSKGEGNPIVFLHCWTCNRLFWKYQIEKFSSQYKCIALDFPGHGKSEPAKKYTPEFLSEIVYELIAKIISKNQKIILVGHSLGGVVALQHVLDHKDNVKGLILVDTTARLNQPTLRTLSSLFALTDYSTFIPNRRMVAHVTTHPLSDVKIKDFIKDQIAKVPSFVIAQVWKDMINFDVAHKLHEIKVPTLIIVGDLDVITGIKDAVFLHLSIKNSKLRIVPRSGHMTILEQPEKFNSYMLEFLQKINEL